jgi:uncharacterized protein YodC (DUF2158 family)
MQRWRFVFDTSRPDGTYLCRSFWRTAASEGESGFKKTQIQVRNKPRSELLRNRYVAQVLNKIPTCRH